MAEASTTNQDQEEQSAFTKNFGFLGQNEGKKDTVSMNSKVSLLGSGKAIIVNCCQKGNPVLELIKSAPWRYADSALPVDYILAPTTGCLFLSLRYHALKPDYIYDRMKLLRQSRSFSLRVLLCLVDVKDPNHAVLELTKACLVSDITLLMAFSYEEVATYLETFKSYQNKPADSIKTRPSQSGDERLTEVLSSIRTVNSTDAHTLLRTYNTVADIAKIAQEDLGICPGIGGIKAKSLHTLFNEPFLKNPNA